MTSNGFIRKVKVSSELPTFSAKSLQERLLDLPRGVRRLGHVGLLSSHVLLALLQSDVDSADALSPVPCGLYHRAPRCGKEFLQVLKTCPLGKKNEKNTTQITQRLWKVHQLCLRLFLTCRRPILIQWDTVAFQML